MNREQRRALERHNPPMLKQGTPKLQRVEVRYGADAATNRVVMVFPHPIDSLRMTPEEVNATIAQLQKGKELLAELRAKAEAGEAQ